jgi:hypothetical protein
MSEELAEDCQRGDNAIKKQVHRTERGSAGSNVTKSMLIEFDPALPRSVLCWLECGVGL